MNAGRATCAKRARAIRVSALLILLLSGCSTRGSLAPHELAALKQEEAVLQVQASRCHNFGLYSSNELERARKEDQAACEAKCYPGLSAEQRAQYYDQYREFGFFDDIVVPPSACSEKYPECRSPIYDAVTRRLAEENPHSETPEPSVLADRIDRVEPDDIHPLQDRCDYVDEKIREVGSKIYFGDPADCIGPCWMN